MFINNKFNISNLTIITTSILPIFTSVIFKSINAFILKNTVSSLLTIITKKIRLLLSLIIKICLLISKKNLSKIL